MSATPNLIFTRPDVHPLFNFKLCQFTPQTTNKIVVQPILHTSSRGDILGSISDFVPKNTMGTHCIKFDSNSSLEAFCTLTKSLGASVEHLTSQDPKKRELNKTYNQIMETGQLARPLDYLVYTTLLEAGVSFKFEVGCMSLIDVNSSSRLGQLCTRARMQSNGINEHVRVNWFLKEKEESEQIEYKTNAVAQFKTMFEKSTKHANELNNCKNIREEKAKIKKATTDVQLWVCENASGVYEVNILGILHELYKRECQTCTPEMMQLRIKRIDQRYTFLETINTDAENEALKDLIGGVKAENEECNKSFNELLNEEPRKVLQAVYIKSKNAELRQSIKTVLDVQGVHRDTMLDYIEEHKECFKTRLHHKAVRGVCQLVENGHSLKSSIALYNHGGIKSIQVQLDLHTIRKRKRASKRGNISAYDAKQLAIYKGIQSEFRNIAKNMQSGRRKAPLSRVEIFNKIQRALQGLDVPKRLSQKQAIEYFEQCFEVERKRTKKGVLFTIKGIRKTKAI